MQVDTFLLLVLDSIFSAGGSSPHLSNDGSLSTFRIKTEVCVFPLVAMFTDVWSH
jgi:hypothetical protein